MSLNNSLNFVALDFETANEKRDSACSIGLVKVIDGVITDRFYSLLRPEPLRFSSFNIRIHGITARDVMHAPLFSEIWPDLLTFIGDLPLVAHNAAFDMSVLRALTQRYTIPCPDLTYFCSVTAAKKAFPELENHKLNTVAGHIGYDFHHHNALEDAEACALVLVAAIKEKKAKGLKEFYDLHVGKSACKSLRPSK